MTETGGFCGECGESTLGEGTDGADEVIVEAVFWDHRLVSVKERDRSLAEMSE